MGYSAGVGEGGKILGQKCPRNEGSKTADGKQGQSKDPVYLTWGAHVYLRGPFGKFMVKYGRIEEVSAVKSRASIVTSDFEIMVTMTRKSFNGVPIVQTCGGRTIYIVVEGRRHCR